MKTICKLQIGTASLDLTVTCMETAVVLRIGDEDSRWRAERAAGATAGADIWRYVLAGAHRIVADYIELGAAADFRDAASAVYVEAGSVGVVRAELCDDESASTTAKLLAKAARRLAGREATVFDSQGRKVTVRVPE